MTKMGKLVLVVATTITLFSSVYLGACSGAKAAEISETAMTAYPVLPGGSLVMSGGSLIYDGSVSDDIAQSTLPKYSIVTLNPDYDNTTAQPSQQGYSLIVQCVNARGEPIINTRIWYLGATEQENAPAALTNNDGKFTIPYATSSFILFGIYNREQVDLSTFQNIAITSEIINKGELVVVFDI